MNILRLIYPQKNPKVIKEKYNIPDAMSWDVRVSEKGLIATAKELPGLVTNARDPQELLEMMNDAVLEYYDVPKLQSDYIFDKLDMSGQGTIYLKRVQEKRQLA